MSKARAPHSPRKAALSGRSRELPSRCVGMLLPPLGCAAPVESFQSDWPRPYKLVMFMLSKSVERGAKLFTHTPALEISETKVDGFWAVKTPRGTIRARKVIFATNGYTAALLPQFKDRIIPVRGVCSRISVPEDKTAPHLPFSYALRHGPNLYDYQVTRPDGSIVVGGARTEIFHQKQEWYNVFDDSKVPTAAAPYFDGFMQRFYRGWEDSDASLDRIWTGIMGVSSATAPNYPPVPADGCSTPAISCRTWVPSRRRKVNMSALGSTGMAWPSFCSAPGVWPGSYRMVSRLLRVASRASLKPPRKGLRRLEIRCLSDVIRPRRRSMRCVPSGRGCATVSCGWCEEIHSRNRYRAGVSQFCMRLIPRRNLRAVSEH